MKSDEMLNQPPVQTDAYADIEQFVGGGTPDQVEQGTPQMPEATALPEGEVQPVAPKTVNLGPGSVEMMDEDGLEKEAERIKSELDLLNLAPEKRYLKRLELEGIPIEEARKIIDTIVVQLGQYRERVPLIKSVSVDLQTRTTRDQGRLAGIIESRQPRYNMTFDHIVQLQNIAASLVRYGSKEFPRETEQDLEAIVEWLEELPIPMFYLLIEKVRDFDRKIGVVFQEGYLENF